mmetsp:Transcript_51848/g.85912  ORF Transcript_51848/g.85912 Transcript_51848/m.85912 type:complete len:105 (+) Transcript_51848:128-442(+)
MSGYADPYCCCFAKSAALRREVTAAAGLIKAPPAEPSMTAAGARPDKVPKLSSNCFSMKPPIPKKIMQRRRRDGFHGFGVGLPSVLAFKATPMIIPKSVKHPVM